MKYRIDERADSRRIKPEIWLSGVLGLVIVSLLGYALLDLMRNPSEIDNSENEAILGEFKGTQADFVGVEGETYSVEIPGDWTQVNSPEQLIDRKKYYPDRYTGVTREDLGQWLDVYYQKLPPIKLDRVLPITAAGSGVIPDSVSPRCKEYTESVGNLDGVRSYGEWEGLEFICTMNTVTNVVGAFESTPQEGIFLEGSNTKGDYLFVYRDHSSRPDNDLFVRILRSFEAK